MAREKQNKKADSIKAKRRRSIEDVSSISKAASAHVHKDQRTTVAIIGAGRLGTALALALNESGYRIKALVARHTRHAQRAAALLPNSQAFALNLNQLDALPATELLFITTPDDQISATAARLVRKLPTLHTSRQMRLAFHASGALASDALHVLRDRGFAVGSMHPLASISEPQTGAESLRRAFYCIEGDRQAVKAARRIVRALGAHSFSINTRDKSLYHAAAVISSGHAVALFDLACALLTRCGLKKTAARDVLLPLLQSTLNNLSTQTNARALTGTFARADLSTVRSHISALQKTHGEEDALAIYALLGRRSLKLAAEQGADVKALREIERVLAAVLKT